MYYYPYLNQLQKHHPYYKPNSIALPLRHHPNLYPAYSHQNNPNHYNSYPKVPYENRPEITKVEVHLAGILCEKAGFGEFNVLEIYGNIMANDTLLWSVDSKNHIKIREGNIYPIQVNKVILLESGQPLRIHGHLWEWDGDNLYDPNDDMGKAQMTFIDFSPDGERHTLKFQAKDQIVRVIFYVRSVE
ncbi:hypothetical protein [Halalkalibacter alkaliphilus]|uniref:Uncharacterized protein n=1 Tax=Halalkalibacter alkaliphilus TaxID=2917993 RepID=A0A9X2I863_9BACI|nr:hypothetical protein [Halalkalibacter alkaliphilus]MCL7749558.1 hypothetical protein [Halalkalibacter alkaliphilus]